MKPNRLKDILEKHKLWLENKPGGIQANLYKADLSGADLSRANLSEADLYGANLSRANLSEADLSEVDLYGANLSRANLSEADLYGANLSGADLSGANLSGADLFGANLSEADLSGTRTAVIPNLGGYFVHIDHEYISIGCQRHLAKDWKIFSDEQIDPMAPNATKYWEKYKNIILSLQEETNK